MGNGHRSSSWSASWPSRWCWHGCTTARASLCDPARLEPTATGTRRVLTQPSYSEIALCRPDPSGLDRGELVRDPFRHVPLACGLDADAAAVRRRRPGTG